MSSSSSSAIPIIDLSPWTTSNSSTSASSASQDEARQAVVDQVAAACVHVGFLAVTAHGVDPTVIQQALTASRTFFDLPDQEKMRARSADQASYPYGYENCENLARGKQRTQEEDTTQDAVTHAADLMETFALGPHNPAAGMPARRLPPRPPELATALAAYYDAMEDLAAILLQIFAAAWNLPADWFACRREHHFSALRILNYFAVENVTQPTTTAPAMIRASAHTDYGPLTILYSGGPGLQVQKDTAESSNNDTTTSWVDVPDIPHAFIINLGDLMQRWTNGA